MVYIEYQWIEDYSTFREALQKVLSCSGQLLKKHYSSKELARPVKAKDLSRLPLDLVNHLMINPNFSGTTPKVIKETPDYLVLHKPSGVHSHPLCYSDQDTLVNFLAQSGHWDSLNVNPHNYDRGLLFRLDFETSGLMLVARNENFLQKMRQNFKDNMKRKLYWAIVEGEFNQEGSWTHYFKSSGAKGSKQKVDNNPMPESQAGELEVRKLSSQKGMSLVLVNLSSGLRHQIRAQLAALGFPILGDELYGGKKADRLFLHAWRYEWDEVEEDREAELFNRFFDPDSSLQMSHNMLSVFKSR